MNESFSRNVTEKTTKGFRDLMKVRHAGLRPGKVCRNHSFPSLGLLFQTLSVLFSFRIHPGILIKATTKFHEMRYSLFENIKLKDLFLFLVIGYGWTLYK